ncbi:MAG TPA: hypothetical protein VLD58_08970, partial [Gemmatimonadales bacterium]|nr:hypothetical protein [Gemmatimonadales bacterium]
SLVAAGLVAIVVLFRSQVGGAYEETGARLDTVACGMGRGAACSEPASPGGGTDGGGQGSDPGNSGHGGGNGNRNNGNGNGNNGNGNGNGGGNGSNGHGGGRGP